MFIESAVVTVNDLICLIRLPFVRGLKPQIWGPSVYLRYLKQIRQIKHISPPPSPNPNQKKSYVMLISLQPVIMAPSPSLPK